MWSKVLNAISYQTMESVNNVIYLSTTNVLAKPKQQVKSTTTIAI